MHFKYVKNIPYARFLGSLIILSLTIALANTSYGADCDAQFEKSYWVDKYGMKFIHVDMEYKVLIGTYLEKAKNDIQSTWPNPESYRDILKYVKYEEYQETGFAPLAGVKKLYSSKFGEDMVCLESIFSEERYSDIVLLALSRKLKEAEWFVREKSPYDDPFVGWRGRSSISLVAKITDEINNKINLINSYNEDKLFVKNKDLAEMKKNYFQNVVMDNYLYNLISDENKQANICMGDAEDSNYYTRSLKKIDKSVSNEDLQHIIHNAKECVNKHIGNVNKIVDEFGLENENSDKIKAELAISKIIPKEFSQEVAKSKNKLQNIRERKRAILYKVLGTVLMAIVLIVFILNKYLRFRCPECKLTDISSESEIVDQRPKYPKKDGTPDLRRKNGGSVEYVITTKISYSCENCQHKWTATDKSVKLKPC